MRTLYVSGVFAAADTLLKIIIIFGMHVPLFLYGCAVAQLSMKASSTGVPVTICMAAVNWGSVSSPQRR